MTMSQATLEPCTVADLEALAELERVGFPLDQYPKARLRYLLSHARASTYKIIEEGGQVLAYAMVLWRKGSRTGHLYSIVTRAEAQGHGFGGLLLAKLEAESIARGCNRMRLEVRADNANAIGFYERRGYVKVKDLPGFYTDDAPGLRMVKRLGG
ncbi:MAG: GNAT family N-acetyltransferase [Chloroflexi bacterium]|nr:GNAT family N-acetyltransferase [Chloroflexota bacterium]